MEKIKIPFIAERVETLRAELSEVNAKIDALYNSPAFLNAADLDARSAAETAGGLPELEFNRDCLVTRLNLLTGSDCIYTDDAAQIENYFSYRNKRALNHLYQGEFSPAALRRYRIEHEEAAEMVAKLAYRRLKNGGKDDV